MKKAILFGTVLSTLILSSVSPILADDEVRKLVVDLKAKGFTQTQYLDNLDSSNIIFAPTDKFQVQLKISNQGNRNQTNVVVTEALPADVTTDSPVTFTIPQIAPGQDYVRNITVTIKDKSYVYKAITNNSLKVSAKTDVGTEASDTTNFFTNAGIKGVSTATSSAQQLPNTGTTSTLIFGSAIAAALAFGALKLRKLARGY